MAMLHYLRQQDKIDHALFIDTRIRVPGLREFVEGECRFYGVPLEVIETPALYERVVLQYGFSGPGGHSLVMNYLKGRAVRVWKKKHPGMILATGVRREESSRRAPVVKEWGLWEGVWVFAPIWNWSNEQVREYREEHGILTSASYQTLHIDGNCLCGAFARKEEMGLIEIFYPELAERIHRLEAALDLLKFSDIPAPRCRWGWNTLEEAAPTLAEMNILESFFCRGCATHSVSESGELK